MTFHTFVAPYIIDVYRVTENILIRLAESHRASCVHRLATTRSISQSSAHVDTFFFGQACVLVFTSIGHWCRRYFSGCCVSRFLESNSILWAVFENYWFLIISPPPQSICLQYLKRYISLINVLTICIFISVLPLLTSTVVLHGWSGVPTESGVLLESLHLCLRWHSAYLYTFGLGNLYLFWFPVLQSSFGCFFNTATFLIQ